jgi:hypothetical protein
MKAVFKKTALDRITEIHFDALYKKKKIDYILLTPEEYDELRRDCHFAYINFGYSRYNEASCSYETSFETVRLMRKGAGYYSNFMVRPETIMGHRIVVAPAEFH